jgi:hypothetical protein
MLEVYDRLAARCGTINQLNWMHILLESSMTPLDVLELDKRLCHDHAYWQRQDRANQLLDPEQFRTAAQSWAAKLVDFHNMSGKPEAEPFHREELLPAVTRFRNLEGPTGKWLVVCLCGNAQLPMMPTASLIQALDARHVDFVLVRELLKNGYRSGIKDLAPTLDQAQQELTHLLGFRDYAGLAFIGLSGGGLPALLFAVASGADSVISVGGNSPHDPRWVRKDGTTAADMLLGYVGRSKLPRVSLLFGQKSFDRPGAEAVAAILPATLHEITEPNHDVGHNAFFPLLRAGRMSRFLVEQLDLPT